MHKCASVNTCTHTEIKKDRERHREEEEEENDFLKDNNKDLCCSLIKMVFYPRDLLDDLC